MYKFQAETSGTPVLLDEMSMMKNGSSFKHPLFFSFHYFLIPHRLSSSSYCCYSLLSSIRPSIRPSVCPPALLLDFQYQVIALQGGVGRDMDRLDCADQGGVDHRLHLHGGQDAQRLTLLHLRSAHSSWRRRVRHWRARKGALGGSLTRPPGPRPCSAQFHMSALQVIVPALIY